MPLEEERDARTLNAGFPPLQDRANFVFYSERIMRLLMEHALSLLGYEDVVVRVAPRPPCRSFCCFRSLSLSLLYFSLTVTLSVFPFGQIASFQRDTPGAGDRTR